MTVAQILGASLCADVDTIFKEVSITIATANQVRSIFEGARDKLQLTGRFVIMLVYPLSQMVTEVACSSWTIVFLDKIHHFTHSQQVSMPYHCTLSSFDTYLRISSSLSLNRVLCK